MLINLISHNLWTTGKVYQQSSIAENFVKQIKNIKFHIN